VTFSKAGCKGERLDARKSLSTETKEAKETYELWIRDLKNVTAGGMGCDLVYSRFISRIWTHLEMQV